MPPDEKLEPEVDVRELRDHLSGYVRHAEGGEVVVTVRGRRAARLSAIGAVDPLAGLRVRGLVQEPERSKRPRSGSGRIKASGSVSDLVAEQRR